MTTPKQIRADAPDVEIEAMVAEIVAGWTDIMDWRAAGIVGTDPSGKQDNIPPYATSADAVLPLLRLPSAYVENPTIQWRGYEWEVTIETDHELVRADAPTVPRAICLALLKANGVEVIESSAKIKARSASDAVLAKDFQDAAVKATHPAETCRAVTEAHLKRFRALPDGPPSDKP